MTNGNPRTQPTTLDPNEVLAGLEAVLQRSASLGVIVIEASNELGLLRDNADPQALSASLQLAEIDAVARRLGALANTDPIDRWQMDETVDQAAEVLRVIREDTLRRKLDAQPQAALEFVTTTLSSSPEHIPQLLAASWEELDVWRREGAPDAKVERLHVVSQLLLDLRHAMSPEDMIGWFSAHRAHLNGQTPLDLLRDQPDGYRTQLRRLAQAPHSVQAA